MKKITKKNYPDLNFGKLFEVIEAYQEYRNRGATHDELGRWGFKRQTVRNRWRKGKIEKDQWFDRKTGAKINVWHMPGFEPLGTFAWWWKRFSRWVKKTYRRLEYKITGVGER